MIFIPIKYIDDEIWEGFIGNGIFFYKVINLISLLIQGWVQFSQINRISISVRLTEI